MAWEDPLKLSYSKSRECKKKKNSYCLSASISFEEKAINFIIHDKFADTVEAHKITAASFELVYKWFGLRENGRLNLCNPAHVGALAVAREVIVCTSNYHKVKRPERLRELSEKIIEKARSYLLIHDNMDVDYRNPIHFIAVSISAYEILKLRK